MLPCIRKRPAPDWLVPFGLYRATGARNVWTSKSSMQNCVSCLSFSYVPQCPAAGVRRRSSGQRVAADTWIPRFARSYTGRCKFHPRVARAQFFIAAQGHLVPRASIFFRHAGVGRKWPDGLYQPWWAHPGRQRRDGVWKPLRRAHPSCGRGGWEVSVAVILICVQLHL